MDKYDLEKGWNRLKSIFDRMPNLTKEVGDEWFKIFERFPANVFELAIGEYIANEQYKPTPNQLLHYCIKIDNEIFSNRLKETQKQREDCRYCAGTGWFRAKDYYGKDQDCIFPCKDNQQYGADGLKCLNGALADERWKWSDAERAFIRRGWVGDDNAPPAVTPEVMRQAFDDNEVSNLFG